MKNTPYPYSPLQGVMSQSDRGVEYGQFFPPYFASTPYNESISSVHWPLTPKQQQAAGFRTKQHSQRPQKEHSPISEIPDSPHQADESITQKSFWDEEYQRPFKIRAADLKFCKENNVPLPNQYYLHRIKDNFSTMFCNGELRNTKCAKTGKTVMTSLPEYLGNRILSEEAYVTLIQ
jgi:hypothetical protein